jgi:DNA invertase Pin-like site-specific DNA recombinase
MLRCTFIDEDGCYDPSDFNDSLMLGMKGTFAQAELHIIRARLHGGKLNKARKGELRFSLPVGYVFDGDKIALDPDQEVQGAVRTVFELFEREGSAYAVVRCFNELGLRFPRRSRRLGWKADLGPIDASTRPRSVGESMLCRNLRIRTTTIL